MHGRIGVPAPDKTLQQPAVFLTGQNNEGMAHWHCGSIHPHSALTALAPAHAQIQSLLRWNVKKWGSVSLSQICPPAPTSPCLLSLPVSLREWGLALVILSCPEVLACLASDFPIILGEVTEYCNCTYNNASRFRCFWSAGADKRSQQFYSDSSIQVKKA